MLPLPCITLAIANRVPREMKYSRSFFKSRLFLHFSQFLSSVYFFWPYIPVANTVLFHDEKKKISAATCRPTQLCPLLIPLHVSASVKQENRKIVTPSTRA